MDGSATRRCDRCGRDVLVSLPRRGRRGRGGLEPHLELSLLDPHVEDRQRVERGRRQHIARADVELGSVAGADDDCPVEVAVGEGALLVGARVVEGDPAALDPAEADRAAGDLDPAEGAVWQLLRRADAMPGCGLAHGAGSNPSVSSSGGTPRCSAACEAALSTFGRRVTSTITNQASATAISPSVQYMATQL